MRQMRTKSERKKEKNTRNNDITPVCEPHVVIPAYGFYLTFLRSFLSFLCFHFIRFNQAAKTEPLKNLSQMLTLVSTNAKYLLYVHPLVFFIPPCDLRFVGVL